MMIRHFFFVFLLISLPYLKMQAAGWNDNVPKLVAEPRMPELPQEATSIPWVANTVICLNEQTGNGDWQFLYAYSDDVPAPVGVDCQDFDFTAWDTKRWDNVKVPSNLSIQGYNIEYNQEYYYKRALTVPTDWAGHRAIIRFDAVYSNARVWIDGRFVRNHSGGFTTWDTDITDFITPGKPCTLVIGVTDLYGTGKGTWNPNGDYVTDPSGASYYANMSIAGINRDVSLIALPKDYVAYLHTVTTFKDRTFTDAYLDIRAKLGMVSGNAKLRIALMNKDGATVASDTMYFAKNDDGYSDEKELRLNVTAPDKWDAEHPNLYTLKTTLFVDNTLAYTSAQQTGFRQIDFGGIHGTDRNKVYINGQEVKLRGVCRHDVSNEFGRSTTKELDWKELSDYKKNNINFIRTSHYTVSRHLLDAADALGIYVEEENAACWGGPGMPFEEVFLSEFREMVTRDRNRPCILLWSIANESTWAPQFRLCYDWIRTEDPTRLVIFSFPATVPASETDVHFDIYSVHYDGWGSQKLGGSDIPVLHDEYGPSAVHHYYELQRDLSVRNAFGASIYKFWNNLFESDGALGGAVWAAGDEVFYVSDAITRIYSAQGHQEGSAIGYGNWGNVHDAYKREKPEAFLTKKGYSPIRLDEKIFTAIDDMLRIPVKNYFDHTNYSELIITYSIDGGPEKTATSPLIAPHAKGYLVINDAALPGADEVRLRFISNACEAMPELVIDEFLIRLTETKYIFYYTGVTPPDVKEDTLLKMLTVKGTSGDFAVEFDMTTGMINKAVYNEKILITGGPHFHVADIDHTGWTLDAVDGFKWHIIDESVLIVLQGSYSNGQKIDFFIILSDNGNITTIYKLTSSPFRNNDLGEVGISYDIPADIKSVDWIRDTRFTAYPDDHIGRAIGEALKERPGFETTPDPYGLPAPTWGWHMDMKDYSLFTRDDPQDGIVTNDFKTRRENIRLFNVNYDGTDSKIRVISDAEDAARVWVKPDWELVDCSDTARITYTGAWEARKDALVTNAYNVGLGTTSNYAYHGTERIGTAEMTATLHFNGTGVSIISDKDSRTWGHINIYIDGALSGSTHSRGDWGQSKRRILWSINGLTDGLHTVRIEVTAGAFALDAFAVLNKPLIEQKAQLLILQQWFWPALNWGSDPGTPGALAEGSTGLTNLQLTNKDNYKVEKVKPQYIPVTDISGAPEMMMEGVQRINAVLHPTNASRQEIEWRVKNAGTTGLTVMGAKLSAAKTGTAVVTATIEDGIAPGKDFVKDFTIEVKANRALASKDAVMYTANNTGTEAGHPVSILNDGVSGGLYWTDFASADGHYYADYPNDAVIGVKLGEKQTVSAIDLFILHDGGGCFTPVQVVVQYWDGSTFMDVPNQSITTGLSGNLAGGVSNLITFDVVTTNDIRLVMKHDFHAGMGRAIALTELAVY